jgi:hypothetical protein
MSKSDRTPRHQRQTLIKKSRVSDKILIRCILTRRYFRGLFEWTFDAESAIDFPTTTAATNTCRNYELTNVQIVVYVQGGLRVMPLPDSWLKMRAPQPPGIKS